ncbi:MAG: hypothetical protein H7A54_06815 [Akkermansiaceae bacterium]|nr:hypothetical protein [Akkermansiaceae bacterium]
MSILMGGGSCRADREIGPVEVFRTGDELIFQWDRFDLLREAHPGLKAVLKLRGRAGDKEVPVDLADPAVKGTLVVDLSSFGICSGWELVVVDGAGKPVLEQRADSIPEASAPGRFADLPGGAVAFIEKGKAMGAAGPYPRISLPSTKELRPVMIDRPARSVSKAAITIPVTTDAEPPLRGAIALSRQTDAPLDATRASLYLSYKKAIFAGGKLDRWHKFLVEVPIQSGWGKGVGDETVDLGTDIKVHITNEVGKPDWQGIQHNILGDDDADLGQTAAATDDEGRIYWMASNGLVRFDPATARFERAPGDFSMNSLQKLCPGGDVMKGSPGWLSNGVYFVCTRGRVFLTVIGDSLSGPTGSDTPARRIGGVFSVSQDWSDAAAFTADIRLHVGSWEKATPTLYPTPPPLGADARKLGHTMVTDAGLFIQTAGGKYAEAGGPWRLDLDDQGHTKAFGEVTRLADTVSKDGRTAFPPTQETKVHGVTKTSMVHVGTIWGRKLVAMTNPGELIIPRSSIRQLLMSDGWDDALLLPANSKHSFRTYAGAPEGVVTVKYDVMEKVRQSPDAKGALADSLKGGPSLGPCYLVTPIPGQADQALAVCEYAVYPLANLDFSRIGDRNAVTKTSVPPGTAVTAKLGPYDSLWVDQGDERWLYITGYTGMTRIQYAKAGKVSAAMTSDVFHSRMSPQAVDGHPRGGLKQYDRIFPVFGGRLMNSGTGRSGRGGTAFTTGLELFDPKHLGAEGSGDPVPSQTSAYLSRCCGALGTLQSRLVWNAADGSLRQEIFGSGRPSQVYVDELEARDKAFAPSNLEEKIFRYEVRDPEGLRDLFGFSVPRGENGESPDSFLALSPCHRFLVILLSDGSVYSFHLAENRFVDGITMKTPAGPAVEPVGFRRPGETILTAPDGQLYFLAAPSPPEVGSVQFNRLVIGRGGELAVEPHLEITGTSPEDWQDLPNSVRCFMPDLKNRDGSVDFIVGWDSKDRTEAKPFVRVIPDFVPPRGRE